MKFNQAKKGSSLQCKPCGELLIHTSPSQPTTFDHTLTKPEVNLTKPEEKEVKQVAKVLLENLKREKLVLDWRKRQQSRAVVQLAIAETLDQLPQSYSTEIYKQKCNRVYQHIYDSYQDRGKNIYTVAA